MARIPSRLLGQSLCVGSVCARFSHASGLPLARDLVRFGSLFGGYQRNRLLKIWIVFLYQRGAVGFPVSILYMAEKRRRMTARAVNVPVDPPKAVMW